MIRNLNKLHQLNVRFGKYQILRIGTWNTEIACFVTEIKRKINTLKRYCSSQWFKLGIQPSKFSGVTFKTDIYCFGLKFHLTKRFTENKIIVIILVIYLIIKPLPDGHGLINILPTPTCGSRRQYIVKLSCSGFKVY